MSGVITLPFVPSVSASRGMFADLPVPLLQQWKAEALAALHQLSLGSKVVSLSYNSGDGQKMTSFSRTNKQQLVEHIAELNLALGIGGQRRAIDVRFGG
jgi:hypothetical protein